MAEVSASMVKDLREATGLGMMECKKALVESHGDMQAAEQLLRIKSGAKAGKVAGRIAAEGRVAAFVAVDRRSGALVEVNCETDFVAKDESFAGFAQSVAEAIADSDPSDVGALADVPLSSGESVEAVRKALIAKLGENISVRRFVRLETEGRLAVYLHGAKIGVLVDYHGGDENLGKDIAMHIAAMKPVCVAREDVPADLLASERAIYTAQAADSGKPAAILEKMVDGRIAKYLAEVTLLEQPFVKDGERTVQHLLKASDACVNRFQMFVVGQGIEKKANDFVAEVISQAKG
ncbi:MAG: translation elongation factor Ts [Burkholderiales bacterium]|nr:elongation factor Ts [Burkholderiales bacterium]MDQ3197415.1 translation elongation factor Ts [Pseudomonadota bacterium]